ncbi:unnamed protein product, partial [Prorocentrum cordatum]
DGRWIPVPPQPVARQAPWRRVAQELARDSLRGLILQNRQEFEAAKTRGSSEPAAQACSAASAASAEKAPEAVKVKIGKCSDPKCMFKNFGFREYCRMCTASAPPHILEWHSAIRRRAMQGVQQEPKEEPQGAAKLKVQQEGVCTKETEDQLTMKERLMMLAAERDTLRAISCQLEDENRCCAQSVLERRPDSVLTSHPAASTSEMVPPKTKKNRWSRQQDREALVESLVAQGNGVAEQSAFWGLDTLGNGTNNREDEEKDHGPNPVGAALYGH